MTDRAGEEIREDIAVEFYLFTTPSKPWTEAEDYKKGICLSIADEILNLSFNGKDGKTYKLGVYCEDAEVPFDYSFPGVDSLTAQQDMLKEGYRKIEG